MINPKFLLNTTNELLNELKKLKIEYSNSISDMKKLFDDQNEMIKKMYDSQKEQIDNSQLKLNLQLTRNVKKKKRFKINPMIYKK